MSDKQRDMVFVAYKTNSTNTPFSFLLFTSYSTYCISTCAMAGTENSEETTVFPDSVVYSYLTTWEISEYIFNKIADVVIIFIAFVLLMCSLVGFSIYLLYMRKDEANKDRLLNVLYANLSICSISFCWVMFVQFLLLDTIYDTESVWWCLLVRWRLFIGLFTTLLFLQISVVKRRIIRYSNIIRIIFEYLLFVFVLFSKTNNIRICIRLSFKNE